MSGGVAQQIAPVSGQSTPTVNIQGAITASPTRQTVLKAVGHTSSATTTDICTVTAGKTAYLVGYTLSLSSAGAAATQVILKDSDGIVWDEATVVGLASVETTVSKCLSFPQGSEPALAATKKWQIQQVAAGLGDITVFYYEL